ncbi:MAG: MOSC domain-containing protein [Capsulimonadaceae bacterium]
MAHLAAIYVYPVKSLNPVSVPSAAFATGGGLVNDRRWAVIDENGKFVNGKRNPRVHGLTASVSEASREICLYGGGDPCPQVFSLDDGGPVDSWLSAYFDQPVSLRENDVNGFPDDLKSPGPTLISTATIEAVTAWYPGLTPGEVRLRFRANLEFGATAPFWEDRLYSGEGRVVRFRIGDVELLGNNPCQRCIVPTRDTRTGVQTADFSRVFADHRQETLPEWAEVTRFNHYYRLSVNTRIPPETIGRRIFVGDPVEVIGVEAADEAPVCLTP